MAEAAEAQSWKILAERANERADRWHSEFDAADYRAICAEAQRDEAVELLAELPSKPCPQDCSHTACITWKTRRTIFLNRLSTVTPDDWQKHQKERAQNAGKTEAELREQYQACERVTRSCCHADWCLTHDRPGGECEVKADG